MSQYTHKNMLLTTFVAGSTLALMAFNTTDNHASGEEHHDTVHLELHTIFGVDETGSPNHDFDAACQEHYQSMQGQTVDTEYRINPSTMIMSADAKFHDAHATLNPMGIEGTYAFISGEGIPAEWEEMGIRQANFEIDTHFEHPKSSFLAHQDEHHNCVITSGDAPADH